MTLQAKLTLGAVLMAAVIVAAISAVYLGNIMELQFDSGASSGGRCRRPCGPVCGRSAQQSTRRGA